MTWKNPNPYNSEAYYDLGLKLFYQGRYGEAYDAFFKATWTNEQQEMSFYFLAAIASMKKDYLSALELVEKGLVKNSHNIKFSFPIRLHIGNMPCTLCCSCLIIDSTISALRSGFTRLRNGCSARYVSQSENIV